MKPETRIGYGWDSHEFKRDVPLKIGGMTLPHPKGLGGHSDGDVLLHALTDALLGAVAAPDIGTLFSPSDPRWKGADSALFLAEAVQRVKAAGYGVVNVDSTLILAAPQDWPTPSRFARPLIAGGSVRLRRPEGQDSGGYRADNAAIAHTVVLLENRGQPARPRR